MFMAVMVILGPHHGEAFHIDFVDMMELLVLCQLIRVSICIERCDNGYSAIVDVGN